MISIVNSDAYARFITAGLTLIAGQYTGALGAIQINEATGGSVVDAYHEAWHAFSQLFLTRAEKIALYEELRKSNPKYKNYSFLQLEEILAEDFRSYALNQKTKPSSPKRNSLFRRILNFLRKLFGKTTSISDNLQQYDVESEGVAGELFKNLYLASNNPELLNIYTPSIDNVMFDILNRGITQTENKNEIALNQKDTNDVVESIDSVISDIIDEQYQREKSSGKDNKAGTTKIITDLNNRKVAYQIARLKFIEKIDEIKSRLKIAPEKPFTSFNTIKDLEDNASAIIRSKNGDHKYIFLATQIEDYNNLDLATKGDQRVKGELYKDQIEIVGDFYTHKSIKDSTKDNATIIVVNDISEGKEQYDNYIDGGAKSFTSFELNPLVTAESVANIGRLQAKLLDNLRVLQTAVKNWDSVIKYHEKNSSFEIISSTIDLVEDDATTDVTKSEKIGKDIGKESLFELGGKDVIYILRSLHKVTKQGDKYTTEKDNLGFKKLVDFKKVWNNLVRITESTKDPEIIYNKIVEASNRFPELKQLVEFKLPKPDSKNNSYEFDNITSFWSVFSLPRVPYMQLSLFKTDGGISTEVTPGSLDVKTVVKQFQYDYKSNKESKYVFTDNNNNVYLNLKKIVNDFADSSRNFDVRKASEFLKVLGITLDNNERINSEITNANKLSRVYGLPYIYDTLKAAQFTDSLERRTEAQDNLLRDLKLNPIGVLINGIDKNLIGEADSRVFKNGSKQKTQIERIAELQVRYGSAPTSFSSTNAERNRINEHTTDNTFTVLIDALNTVEKKTDMYREGSVLRFLDPRKNPMAKSSFVLRNLFDANDNKKSNRSIKYFQQSGTQETNNEATDGGQNTTSLSQQGKLLQEFHTMLKAGHQEIMRPGSKSSAWGWLFEGGFVSRKTIGQKSEPFLYADINSFIPQTGTEREVIEEIILPYLASETNRINVFKSNPEAKNYIGYNQPVNDSGQQSGEVYNYFDGILNSETKKEILEKVNSPSTDLLDYLKTDPDLYNKIVNEIANYFDKKSVELLDEIKKTEFIDFKLINRFGNIELSDEQRKQVLAKAFFYNSWIHNVETSILFFTGDIAQLDHSKDAAFKRLSGLISNGPRIRTDIYAQLFISNSSEGGFNSNTYAKSLGEAYDKFKYDGYINTAIIEDISRDSIFMSEIKEGLIADFKRRNSKLSDREIEIAVERAVKKYSKSDIKEGDGQGYITIDSYRAIKKLMNKWSPQQENLYKKIINKEEIPLTDYIEGFPVLKLQNFGWVEDTILPVQAMHKFALMPLIPSAVKGTQLEELHKKMLEKNIQYVTFASGSKISGVTSNGKPDQVFEDGGKALKESVTFTNNRINAAFIKEATSVSSKSKGKVIFSTQLRKLILEGLKENGQYVSDKAKELGSKYESLVNFYNELVRKELENEIGYRKDESGTYIGNPSKFLKLIQTNLKAKDYPQHLIDQLKTNSDGTLQYDLSYFLDTETIENIVMSLIEKRLVKQKVNGEALVQVANSMWNGTWDVTQGNKFANLSKEELEAARKKYLGTNGLPFYTKGKDGKTLPMKVAITLQGDFFNLLNLQHLDGQPIKTIHRLNAMIKEDAWLDIADNRKSVTLTAVRIPVQGLNSMEFMEVYEFLDPSAINMIIPPTEIVAKSGSDFDVDKLTTFFPNINKDGSYVRSSISNQNFFKEVSALENQEKNPKDVISTQKKAAENEFIETIKSILEIEENYASLVTPNDTSILEDIAIKLQDLVSTRDKYAKVNDEKPNVSKKGTKYASPTSIFEPLTNVEKHAQNLEGKRGLGIVANQNALNPLYTSIGGKMPKKYKPAVYNKKYGRYVESKKSKAVFDVRLFLPHNEIDGHISLSNIYTNDNIYKIAEIFSQALNGTVDVETNPWIFYIQGNVQALPVLLYLTETGVSPEDAVYFISNPLIREYTENQRLKGGVFGRASRVAPELPAALKYESAKQVFDKYKERFILDRIKSLSNSTELTIEYFRKNPVTDASEKVFEKITKGAFINQLPILAPNLNLVKAEGVAQVIYRNFIPSNKNVYAVSSFLSNIPGVLRRGSFDKNSMFEMIQKKGELSPEQLTKSLAMLAHYVEIENQLRGINALKNLSKPDVRNLRTPQEAIKRELDVDLAFDNSKIDLETAKGVLEESIIASFGDKDIIEKIFMPMMDLINGPKVNRFLLDAMGGYEGNSKLEKIVDSKKYKATQEGLTRFNRDFKSGLKTFVFQNYLSNTVFEDGKFVMIPNKYRQQEVKIDNSIDTDVTIKDGVFLINQNRIREDYTNKRYLDTSTSAESYTERQGLEAFPSNENDLFPTEESYIRYVLERENLFQKGLRGDELNQFALINTFNPGVIINPGKYSYSDLVMKTIDKHRSTLSRQFSIIDQIRKYVEAGANKSILTLTNRDVIDGNTATLYASELKQLGNAKIQKVKNTETSPEENERLSRIFKLFPLLMIYQHGAGKTLNGFDNVLPQDDYLKIMKAAGDLFKNNYNNNKTYDFVLDKITDPNNRRFIDFTVTDTEYSQYIPKVLPAEETEITFEDEEFQQPTQAPGLSENQLLNKVGDIITRTSELKYKTVTNTGTIRKIEKTENGYNVTLNIKGYDGGTVINVIIENGKVVKSIQKNPLKVGEFLENTTSTYDFKFSEPISTAPTTQPVVEVKEGVAELFDSNPELANIGTVEQYSAYLDSKDTPVVYHGSPEYFEEFDESKLGTYTGAASAKEGIFFGSSKDVSKSYLDKRGQTLNVDSLIKAKYGTVKKLEEKAVAIKEGGYEIAVPGYGWVQEFYRVLHNGDVIRIDENGEEYINEGETIDSPSFLKTLAEEKNNSKNPNTLKSIKDKLNKNNIKDADLYKNYKLRREELEKTYDSDYGGYIDKDRSITDKPFENLFIRPYTLNLKNPYIVSDEGSTYREESYYERIKKAKELGHDGVIIKDTFDSKFQTKPEDIYVVFKTNQIEQLGGKQDIEGFKRFVSTQPTTQPIVSNISLIPENNYTITSYTNEPKKGTYHNIIRTGKKPLDYKVIDVSDKGILVRNEETQKEKLFTKDEYFEAFNISEDAGFSVLGEYGLAEVYRYTELQNGQPVYSLEINLYDESNEGKGLGKDIYKAAIQEIVKRNGVLTPGNVVKGNKVWESFERDGLLRNEITREGDSITVIGSQPTTQIETKAETIQEPGTVASKTTAQIPLSDTNIAKVLDGSKVVTTRKELIPDDTYLAGDTQQVKIKYLGIARVVGNSVVITNEKTNKSSVRSKDSFAKAEGFKNWSDYTDNNRFIQGFIKGDTIRYVFGITPAGKIQQMTTVQQRLSPENNPVIGLFNEELARTNGVYPKEFIYESSEGTNKYVLSENNLYNLVDIDTGSIYLRNIDLTTGNIVSDVLPQTPVGKDSITKFINTLNSQIKEYRIDIVLANKGIDVNEIIDRAENVNSEEELNELRIIINKNLC
jgi:hypothetical protein